VRSLLSQPRSRRKHNAFLAEGVRLVEEGIRTGFPLHFILYSNALSPRGLDLIHSLTEDAPVSPVETRLFQNLGDTETSQGILAVFELAILPMPDYPDLLLILDNLRDPGNLGTILRTAEAAGVQAVLLAPGTTDAFAPKVVRAGMGAHFHLPIHALEWQQIAQVVTALSVYRAEMHAELTLWQADLTQPCALLIGSEAEGVSQPGLELAPQSVSIPMPGQSESLNAAVAAGILLFEVQRQRIHRK
jgi:TrmH family RNA methyltransferase